MQPMSDKELDKLFQEKFDSFEVEPSAGLWAKIDAEMGEVKAEKKKRIFPIFWMAAASVLIVMAAGLYFIPKQPTIKLQGKDDTELTASQPKPNEEDIDVVKEPSIVPENQEVKQASGRKLMASVNTSSVLKGKYTSREAKAQASPEVEKVSNMRVASSAVEPAKAQDIVSTPQPEREIGKKVTPPSLVAMLNVPEKDLENPGAGQALPRRKIKSLGDLVNRVVAKVDPRDEKIIQFTDNDEGTEVSGINLGLIKFKHNHNNK